MFFFFASSQQLLQQAHSSKVHLNSLKNRWNFYGSIRNSIFKFCERREWNENVVFQLFLCSQLEDIHRLNTDVILQSGLFEYGRADIFTIMTPLDFMVWIQIEISILKFKRGKNCFCFSHQLQKLTAGPSSTYLLYTHLSCLFQIIFDYELLAEFPIDNFLPWHRPKSGFGGKVNYNIWFLLQIFFLFSLIFASNFAFRLNTIQTHFIWCECHRNETYFQYVIVTICHGYDFSSTNACSSEKVSLFRNWSECALLNFS